MTTSAVSAVVAQTTNAQFEAWISEIITALFTTIGLTQTSDTGQINPGTVAIPAINTSAGYVIGRFNDSLQSTAPIFFKLEFGAAGATADPMMWLTVGTSSNGSGTIGNGGGGAVSTRVALAVGLAPSSTTTALTSRYCYVGTSACGCFWMAWKYGGTVLTTLTGAMAGFAILRTNDGSGNATGTGICILAPSQNASAEGNSTSAGFGQVISFASGALIPSTPQNGWESAIGGSTFIYSQTTLLESSVSFVAPIYTIDPVVRYSAYAGSVLIADFSVGTTSSFALVGSNDLTFISAGAIFGASGGFNTCSNRSLCLPWQ
jgi:hypothetical protein